MAIEISWQGLHLYLGREASHSALLLSLAEPDQHSVVEHWAAQADSVPEFLEMLHLEGLIDLDRYRTVVQQHDPLYAAATAMLACLPHLHIQGRLEDPTRELFPLIERMAQALEPFVSDPLARAILADALGTYWASWVGRYEHLDHEVNAARQVLNAVLTGASNGVLILRPADITLTPEAVGAMIGYVLETHTRGEENAHRP